MPFQVPCWLRPRDRTRSPDILSNTSRPTTLPLRIPPRISITQADADRFTPYIKPLMLLRAEYLLIFLMFSYFLLQLRGRKWRVPRSYPSGLPESKPHVEHLLPSGPEKRVLLVPLWLRLWHVAKDRLPKLHPCQWRVSQNGFLLTQQDGHHK